MRLQTLLPVLAGLAPLSQAVGYWGSGPMRMITHEVKQTDDVNQKTWFAFTLWSKYATETHQDPTVGDAIDLAASHMAWLRTQEGCFNQNTGLATVSVMWDPVAKAFWASSVPRGTRNSQIEESSTTPEMSPWFDAAPYSGNFELKPVLHAEDNLICTWIAESGVDLKDGKFPLGTYSVAYTASESWVGAVRSPCGPNIKQNRAGGCIVTAYNLGIFGWLKGDDRNQKLTEPQPLREPPALTDGGSNPDLVDYAPPASQAQGSSRKERRDSFFEPLGEEKAVIVPGNKLEKRVAKLATTSAPSINIGGELVSLLDTPTTAANQPTSRLNTVEDGVTMVEIGSFFYWSYTFSWSSATASLPGFTTPASAATTSAATTSAATTAASAASTASDPPCIFSDDSSNDGACVCSGAANAVISPSMSNGQPCPWTTMPWQAYSAQAAATMNSQSGQAARRDIAMPVRPPTTLVTQTA